MKNLRKLFSILGPWRAWYAAAGVLLIATSFIRMLEPKVIQVVVDGVVLFFQSQEASTSEPGPFAKIIYNLLPEITLDNLPRILLLLAVTYLVIAGLRALTMLAAGALTASSTERAVKSLRDRLFRRILELPLQGHDEIPTGEMVQRSTGDVDTVRRFMLNDVAEMIRLGALFVGAFIMMVTVHVPYALIAVSLVPIIGITSVVFFRKEAKVWQEHEDEQDKLTAIVQENLSGIRVVKAFAREPEEINRFDKQNDVKFKVGLKHVDLHKNFWSVSDALVNLQVTLSLIAGTYFTLNQAITLGEFASFFTYSIMVTWPLRQVGQVTSRMGMAAVAAERMYSILERDPEDYQAEVSEHKQFAGAIEFRNVSFAYPTKPEEKVLENLSFKIQPGENVALVGPTGSGKSTVVALLQRFYEPDSGNIYLDGVDISTIDKGLLRARIGAVLQRPFLFSSSIRANIAYANPDASGGEVESAARDASILEVLERFPTGLDTVVGEKGLTLSGGQQQRVALARTLLADPDVLVLDDTASAVDPITERKIATSVEARRGRRTSLSIAHRLTSLEAVERILVLEKGRLVQDGRPEQLRTEPGYYAMISEIQLED